MSGRIVLHSESASPAQKAAGVKEMLSQLSALGMSIEEMYRFRGQCKEIRGHNPCMMNCEAWGIISYCGLREAFKGCEEHAEGAYFEIEGVKGGIWGRGLSIDEIRRLYEQAKGREEAKKEARR